MPTLGTLKDLLLSGNLNSVEEQDAKKAIQAIEQLCEVASRVIEEIDTSREQEPNSLGALRNILREF